MSDFESEDFNRFGYAIIIHAIAYRAQSTVDFPIGGHVNVLSDCKETAPEIFLF